MDRHSGQKYKDEGSLRSSCTMRAFVFVLLATVSVHGEAEADPYTVGQVAHGLTNGGVITGVDHGHGVVSGVGAIGNRAIHHLAGVNTVHNVAGVYSGVPVNTVASTVPVYNTHHAINTPAVRTVGVSHVYPNVYSNVYSGLNHVYGKREAEPEAEAEADPLLYNTAVSHGVYPYTAVRAGVTHAVPSVYAGVTHAVPTVTGVTHAVPTVTGVTHAVPAVRALVTPAVPSIHAGVYSPVVRRVGVSSVYPNVYSGLNHVYGKREAEPEAEAEADPLLYNTAVSHGVYPYTAVRAGVTHAVPSVYSGVTHAVPTVTGVTHAVPTVTGVTHAVP